MRARAAFAAVLLLAAGPFAAAALAASTPPKAAKVSYSALRRDAAAGKGKVAEINRLAHSVELVLSDGRRERALYPSHDEKRLVADLRAKHVTVVFRHAKHHHKKGKGGHPLRIAAAIVAVVAAGLAVFLLARRRGSARR